MQYLRVLLAAIFFIAGVYSTPLLDRQISRVKQILRHDHLQLPAGQILMGNIETPGGGTELTVKKESKLVLGGWTVFTNLQNPIQQLDILIDGKKMAEVQGFSSRPDVADAYDRPDFEPSDWSATLSLSPIAPGKHVLLVHATAQNGSSGDMPPLILNVQ